MLTYRTDIFMFFLDLCDAGGIACSRDLIERYRPYIKENQHTMLVGSY